MTSELTYIPAPKPQRPFAKGDVVRVVDREGDARGMLAIIRVLKTRVVTSDGRRWDLDGWWMDEGGRAYPFPTIQHSNAQ